MEQESYARLVDAVKRRPCLYNFNLPEYTRKDIVERAWLDIGKELREDAGKCKQTWRNIRTVFIRSLKLISRSNKEKKPYYLSDMLQFVIPFIRSSTRDCHSSHFGDGLRNLKKENDFTDDFYDDEDDEKMIYDHNDDDDNTVEYIEETRHQNTTTTSGTSSAALVAIDSGTGDNDYTSDHKRKRKKQKMMMIMKKKLAAKNFNDVDDNDDVDEQELPGADEETVIEFCNVQSNDTKQSNANKAFLISLLPDLERMTDRELRQFKKRTLDIVDDIFESRLSTSFQQE